MHHGVTFNFGSAKVCLPAIFETSFFYDKDFKFLSIAKSRIKYYKIILQKSVADNDKKLLDTIDNINWSP